MRQRRRALARRYGHTVDKKALTPGTWIEATMPGVKHPFFQVIKADRVNVRVKSWWYQGRIPLARVVRVVHAADVPVEARFLEKRGPVRA